MIAFLVCIAVSFQLKAQEPLRFAIVPKQVGAQFFVEVRQGCQAQANKMDDVECIFMGPKTADFRLQDQIISDLIDQGVDGLAVSVINSEYLATHSLRKAKERGIPVITFDSDLTEVTRSRLPGLRLAYVGTNNYVMGQELAHGLVSLRAPGIFSVIGGNPSAPNLLERLKGVREVLLSRGWQEHQRSPMFINDSASRALQVLKFTVAMSEQAPSSLQAVISLNSATQDNHIGYAKIMSRKADALRGKAFVVVSADTSQHQLQLLKDGLSSLNVGQNTRQMGALSLKTLHKIHQGHPVKEFNFTSVIVCRMEASLKCGEIQGNIVEHKDAGS